MASPVLVKVYGHLSPVSKADAHAFITELLPFFSHSDIMDAEEMLIHTGDTLQLAFEGIYFDVEDILPIIQKNLISHSYGKIDYLDLEAWQMTRYFICGIKIDIKRMGLNNVMDYAGL